MSLCSVVETDVGDFEAAPHAEAPQTKLFKSGSLLAGLERDKSTRDSPVYNWIRKRQGELQSHYEKLKGIVTPFDQADAQKWPQAHARLIQERIAERLRVYIPELKGEPEEVLRRFFDDDGPHGFWPQRATQSITGGQADDQSIALLELIESRHKCLLLVSQGGGGKSSNLGKLFYEAAQGRLRTGSQAWTPLLFPLQALTLDDKGRLNKSPLISIEETLLSQFLPGHPADWQDSSLWKNLSGTPNLLVLLEGLNEVDDTVRDNAEQLIGNIERMVRGLESSGINYRVVITVRQQEEAQPEGLTRRLQSSDWGRRFVSYNLQPLDLNEATHKVRRVLGNKAERLLNLLGDDGCELLTNPLLLRLMLDNAPKFDKEKSQDVGTITRSDLYDVAVERLLERDTSEQRLVGVLQNARVARQGLEILAAASLEGEELAVHSAHKPKRSGGGTYLSREAVPNLIARSVHKNKWGAAEWWRDLESRSGRPLTFAEVADALLRLNLLDAPEGTHVSFLHETFRDYLASGQLCQGSRETEEGLWQSGGIAFKNLQEHKWEGVIGFAVERSDSVEPLLRAVECDHLPSETRRRALEVWRLFGVARLEDINRIWGVFTSTGERLLLDAAGYALQDILLQPDAEKARIHFGHQLIEEVIESKEPICKIAVAQIARVLGHIAGPEVFKAMLKALSDASPGVRVAALLSFINYEVDDAVLEAIARVSLEDDDTMVRFVAMDVLLAVFRRKRDAKFRRMVPDVVQKFRASHHAPADRLTVVRWLGCSPFGDWTTQILWEELIESKPNDNPEFQTVRWMAARFLCSSFHRAKLTRAQKEELRAIARNEGEPPPLRAVLRELDRLCHLFDDGEGHWPPLPVNLSADVVADLSGLFPERHPREEPHLWREWQHLQQSLDATYHHFFNSAWQNVRLAYSYFSFATREKRLFISHIEDILKRADRESQASAVRLLCCLGVSDAELLRLRLLCLQHSDADVRHHAATSVLNFVEHSALAHQLWENLHNDLDHTARWDAAGSLGHMVGELVLPALIERAHNDASPLARGFLAERLRYFAHRLEAREALLLFIRNEPNVTARARALRGFELVGTKDGLSTLESLFDDTSKTRHGVVKELARHIYEAIEKDPEPIWTLMENEGSRLTKQANKKSRT